MSTPGTENFTLTLSSLEPDGMNHTVFDFVTEQLASALNVYYTPLLVLLGSVGNLLSVVVFYSSKLRLQSTSQYLSALALSDTVFLFQLLPPWMNAIQLTTLFHYAGFCQVFVYFTYVTSCLSTWLVVAFTVERFVGVLYPLRRNVLCTVRRARHVIATLVAAALLLNVPVLRFAAPSNNDCNIDFDYLDHAARFNLIDTALSFTAPLGMIIVLNSWIMVGVCRLGRARRHLVKAHRGGARGVRPPQAAGQRSQHRVTRMLLIVSSVFVVLNMPAYTMRILAYAYDMSSGEYSGRWAALQQLALLFFNTNFGINFILYCLSGQNFRRALRQCVPCMNRRRRRSVAARRSSCHPARGGSVSTSYVSNCTEATSNCGGGSAAGSSSSRHHRSEPVLQRWTFDNSRQRSAPRADPDQPAIELQPLPASAPPSTI